MSCTIVVPCYNETKRLDRAEFMNYLAKHPAVSFVFVDDGSTDGTGALLDEFQTELPDQIKVVHQQPNQGKAEAVRTGMLHALSNQKAGQIGFWDADLATPLDAIDDLLKVFQDHPDVEIVFGARVKLLGRKIERQATRHYLGRVFATCASIVLGLPVYDTQCGAKLFRVTPVFSQVLQQPFCSRWIFDVELIARFLQEYSAQGRNAQSLFYEFPLYCWRDIAGSKVRATDFAKAARELFLIRNQYHFKRPKDSVAVHTGWAAEQSKRN